MQISQLEINNFGKHAHKTVNFQNGSNLIIGPNYSGKSTIMRAIGIALYGNRMTPIATKLLVKKGAKDFHLNLTVQAEPVGFVIERTSSNSSITRLGETSPYVVGHTQVNEEVARLLQMPRDTFRKVFLSEQGSPQQLLAMEGAELQRFVESVTELDDLDAMQKLAGQKAAKAKIQAETLENLMLTDDDYTAKKQRVADMQSTLVKGLEEQAVLEESHAMVKCELDNLQSDISKAIESNKAAEKWYSGKESIKQQIAARPEQELHDTTDLVTQVDALKAKVASLDKEITADRCLAQQWAVYTSDLTRLEASKAELSGKDLTLVPEPELEKLRAEITGLENKISTARVNNARIVLVTAEFDKARAAVDKATEALETHGPERILPDTTEAESAYKEAHDTWAGLCNDVALLERVLEEADCPTCKRPWDQHFDRAAKQSELQAAKEKMGLSKVTLDSAIEELQAVKSERVDGQVHNAKYASLFEQVNACRASLATLKVDLDNLPEIVADSQGVLWQQARDLAKSTLVTAEANNVKVDSSLAALAKIELALASVVIPEGARPTDVDTDAKAMLMAATREELATASSALTDFTTRNTLAQASNSVRITLLNKLKDYPDELDPKLTDVQPLLDKSATLSTQVDTLGSELRKIVATNTSTRLDLQPLKSEVESHESYLTKRAEALAQAKLNSYLGNLIGTHREAFMAKAQATLFEVASEFARLSSDGDIQEVLVHEGNISYKENDQIFPKDTASGSQKSMMGLGMKLGIANLINSDFETFLLDEVSADMSEDISLKCMGALDMLCANSVVITHRPMDVAGNVIDLG